MCLTPRGKTPSVSRVTSIEEMESGRSGFGTLGLGVGGAAQTNNRSLLGNEVTLSGNNRMSSSGSNLGLSAVVPNNRE